MGAPGEKLSNEELAELYRRYGFLLRRRCRTLLREEAAAEDALQDTFVKILQASDALRDAENKVAWMYRVVDRACLDQLRRRRVRRAEPLALHEDAAACHPDVKIEARDAALRILHELSDAEYEVAVLTFVDGLTQTDVATTLGLSRPTIWKRLMAVRERVTRIMGAPQ
ncbi:MAG TPA: sigma-70 family RNA polymerase sigma factor [Caldimonas sp.]|nr:sigma-70 family RNA polymerase sigma factor [Caldimonas sp.]